MHYFRQEYYNNKEVINNLRSIIDFFISVRYKIFVLRFRPFK